MKRIHLLIHGRVQMVGFRYSTARKAQQLGVKGWIKNLPSGEVEAVLEGEDFAVTQLIEFCKKGPLFAHVSNLEIKEEPYKREFKQFEIRYK